MGTPTGDLDAGVAWYLMQNEKPNPKEFNHLINHESGLPGISETNSDMTELMKIEETDNRAKEVIKLFCYQTKRDRFICNSAWRPGYVGFFRWHW